MTTIAHLPAATLAEIARIIREDWHTEDPYPVQMIDAMAELRTLDTPYFAENGRTVVGTFLAICRAWHGETARAVKKELWRRLRAHDRKPIVRARPPLVHVHGPITVTRAGRA